MVEPQIHNQVKRVDGKLVTIGLLFGAVCAMAGWIVSDALHQEPEPLTSAEPAAVSAPVAASPTADAASVQPIIQVATSVSPPPPTAAAPAASPTPNASAARSIQTSSSVLSRTIASARQMPTVTQLFSGTWIQVTASDGSIVFVALTAS